MQVIEEINGKAIPFNRSKRIVVSYSPEVGFIYGYVNSKTPTKIITIDEEVGEVIPSLFGEENIIFSTRRGKYMAKQCLSASELLYETKVKGSGGFPYDTIIRNYEAVESFDYFKGNQKVLEPKEYILSDFFPYTFGLEFETSQGYIPEDICYRDGLIPLRDGSIKGIEYSTVILQGNQGFGLLEQQLQTLKKYTWFDKDCSLHVHIGNFPLNQKSIYNLYRICKKLESSLERILPPLTFRTDLYKSNGKSYCKKLPVVHNFNQLYEYLVGRKFYGSFTQGHPNDIKRTAKWRISTRYFWCNFVNLLCYKVNKTVEFRFLRPTYNFEKIILWFYIFNAILQYAETDIDNDKSISLETILYSVYPPEIVERLKLGISGLQVVRHNQESNNDHIGGETVLEDDVFAGAFNITYK